MRYGRGGFGQSTPAQPGNKAEDKEKEKKHIAKTESAV